MYLHEPWSKALTVLVTGEEDPVTVNDTADIAEAGTVNARASQGEPTVTVKVVSTLAIAAELYSVEAARSVIVYAPAVTPRGAAVIVTESPVFAAVALTVTQG